MTSGRPVGREPGGREPMRREPGAGKPVELDIGLAAIAPVADGMRSVRARHAAAAELDRALWRDLAGFGWLGLRIAEDAGGAGLDPRALCALGEALGERLLPEPLLAASLAARLLPASLRAPVLAGERVVLPAWRDSAGAVDRGNGTVLRDGLLFGRKLDVAMARGADAFLVVLDNGLALVASDAPGLRRDETTAPGGGNHAALVFDGAPAEGFAADAAEIGQALDEALLAECAYLLGLAERAFSLARPVGPPHGGGRPGGAPSPFAPPPSPAGPPDPRLGSLRRDLDLTRAVIAAAGETLGGAPEPSQRAAIVSRAALRTASGAIMVARGAAQLHGGLGLTAGSDVGFCLHVVQALVPRLGSQAAHRARIARAAATAAAG